jgi:hypothetical protein
VAEELSIEVGHSPSKPSKDRKVRFSAEATGHVSKLEIVIRWLYAHSRLNTKP